jgi:hypothetical protein
VEGIELTMLIVHGRADKTVAVTTKDKRTAALMPPQ